jgi:hypothetical protein
MTCNPKLVVFDLDETLGYFSEFGMFWDALKSYIKYNNIDFTMNQEFFDKTLDLYPEFLRPNIINILNYLKQKKHAKHCYKLMIYTNNQGPYEWTVQIKSYFENKIKYKLFDQVIAAFMVNGKQVELCRTTNMKTHSDFIKCTKVPKNTDICFIDDLYHPGMKNERIYYINIKPYTYNLTFATIVDRFINSQLLINTNTDIDSSSMKAYIVAFMKKFAYIYVDKGNSEYAVDKIISKKILHHLQMFFKNHNITRRLKMNNQSLSDNSEIVQPQTNKPKNKTKRKY